MSLLGLDVGTSGCKVNLFTYNGEIISSAYREYSELSPEPGWTELNPDGVWNKVVESIRECMRKRETGLEAIAISTLGEAVLPIDRHGNALYPAITPYDQRDRSYHTIIYRFKEELGEHKIFQLTGIPLNSMPSINKIVWMKNELPSIYEKTWKFVCMEDYLIFKLCNQAMVDYNLASRTMMLDIHRKEWSKEILELWDLDEDLLSPVSPSGTVVGHVCKSASEKTGLESKVKVVTGGHDQGCGALGAGVVKEGLTMDATGTVECIASMMKNPILTDEMLEAGHCCHCHTVEDTYISLSFFPSSGDILRWYRDQFASTEKEEAKSTGKDVYDILIKLASKSPPGASKILMLPHFSGGGTGSKPVLNRNSRGAFIGITTFHKKEDIIRSILEGVALELRLIIEFFEGSGIKVSELRAVGGGAKSSFWNQLKADITGKRVCLPSITEAPSLGAAILAGVGVHIFRGIEDAVEKTFKLETVYEPNRKTTELYRRLYEVYKTIYPSLVDIYEEMTAI